MGTPVELPTDSGMDTPIRPAVDLGMDTPIRPSTAEDLFFPVKTSKPTRLQTMNRHRAIRGTPGVSAKVAKELQRQREAAGAHAAIVKKFEDAKIDIAPFNLCGKGEDKVCQSCYQSKDTTDEVNSCFICHSLICRDCSRIHFSSEFVRAKKKEHVRLLQQESREKKRRAGGCEPPEKKGRVSKGDEDDDASDKEGSGSDKEESGSGGGDDDDDDDEEYGAERYSDADLPGICKSCARPSGAKEELVSLLECAGVVLALARAHAAKTNESPDVAVYVKHLWDTMKIDGEAEIDGLMMPTVEQS